MNGLIFIGLMLVMAGASGIDAPDPTANIIVVMLGLLIMTVSEIIKQILKGGNKHGKERF